ncbi:MAG: DNA alkylation repair protein [Clostridia bacterium]|nr:DNA alkylation repair protein [Clostridia bacterium]
MTDAEKYVRERLTALQDTEYREFHSALMPTVKKEKIIGVRVPELRKLAKYLFRNGVGEDFIKNLPHTFYEEDNLHAFIVEQIKDFDRCLSETEKFLPYIDNWATCDMFSPKVFADHTDIIYLKSLEWIASDDTYTIRYGIGMLMRYFLDENFKEDALKIVSRIKSEEYYVNMMIAWFFATALAKQYDSAIKYIETNTLDSWVHNKTIQKAIESNRISKDTKNYLRTLKL